LVLGYWFLVIGGIRAGRALFVGDRRGFVFVVFIVAHRVALKFASNFIRLAWDERTALVRWFGVVRLIALALFPQFL